MLGSIRTRANHSQKNDLIIKRFIPFWKFDYIAKALHSIKCFMLRKKELIPFATAWMELESIMLSEISQAVRDKYHMTLPLTGT